MIEILWELSHRPDMSRELVDKALDEMYHAMVDSTSIKESYKKKYLERCIDSIKKGIVCSIVLLILLEPLVCRFFFFCLIVYYINCKLLYDSNPQKNSVARPAP